MLYRTIEAFLSVSLAFFSIYVYYKWGFKPAVYIMLWAILLNIPPDYENNKKLDKFIEETKQTERAINE